MFGCVSTRDRAAWFPLLLCAAVFFVAASAFGQGFRGWSQRLLQERLKATHEKVLQDSDRIAVLARNLRHEAEEEPEALLAPALRERIRTLDAKANRLREAVGEIDENILSIPVVKLAGEVRDQARSLRKILELHPGRRQLERQRLFCREIEQRAEVVRKRVTEP